jgi:hypothetical protein
MLIPIFQNTIAKSRNWLTRIRARNIERYETSQSTPKFPLLEIHMTDINIEKLIMHHEYEFYLRSERKCANNTAVKYIKNFHKIINQQA